MYLNYGFDLSEYLLKYAGCSSVATFSDEMAQDEESDTVFMTNQYVVFRFCPTQTCSGTSVYGCMQDYGEYMLPIDQWLEIIVEYREEEYERYCEYCADCQEEQEYYQEQVDVVLNVLVLVCQSTCTAVFPLVFVFFFLLLVFLLILFLG